MVALVESDNSYAELIEFNLQQEGFATQRYLNQADLLTAISDLRLFSLFIVDLFSIRQQIAAVCLSIRESLDYQGAPILLIGEAGLEHKRVECLNLGADEIMNKPFSIKLFIARVHSLIRFYAKRLKVDKPSALEDHMQIHNLVDQIRPESSARMNQIALGPLMIDDLKHRVFLNHHEIELTNREYDLLKFLMLHRDIVYRREELLNHVWGGDVSSTLHTVDVHICLLRKKIQPDADAPIRIQTVRGTGYRLQANSNR